MSQKALMVVHQPRSDPGRIGLKMRTLGYELEIVRPACGDQLPKQVDGYGAVMVFGGPMSANDEHEEFIRRELDWIPKAADTGVPFLGVCLGAQLLAKGLGAEVAEHPEGYAEIGYHPVRATLDGQAFFDDEAHFYQWHRDGFDIPAGATLLATGEIFENQAFQVGDAAFAIQFHPEVTEAMNRRWAKNGAHRLEMPGAQPAEAQLIDRQRYDPAVARWLDRFLDLILTRQESDRQQRTG